MARPSKKGIDYFTLDCDLNDKFKLIEAEFGLRGFAVVVKLYQRIYKEFGYYCEWTEDKALLFLSGLGGNSGANKGILDEIVAAAIRRGIFNEKLFDRYKILTSYRIQEEYFNAVARRDKIEVVEEYLLVKVDQKQNNVCINSINVDINSINVSNNTQRREEKSREEKSRYIARSEKKYGLYENVILSDVEICQLNELYPDYKEKIDDLSKYMADTNRTYKSHFDTIIRWAKKDESKNSYKNNKKNISFNNFEQRDYNYDSLEKELLRKQKK